MIVTLEKRRDTPARVPPMLARHLARCLLLLIVFLRFRHTAKFVSVKPGPAVSAFMASQGMQPSPDLLQAHAGELNRITLPSGLLQQQAREQQQCAENVAAAAAVAGGLMIMMNSGGSQAGAGGDCSSSSSGGHRAKAAACVAAASDAVAAYEQRRAVCAASVRAGSLSAQMQVQALQRQRAKAIAAGASTAKETSNRVAGACVLAWADWQLALRQGWAWFLLKTRAAKTWHFVLILPTHRQVG